MNFQKDYFHWSCEIRMGLPYQIKKWEKQFLDTVSGKGIDIDSYLALSDFLMNHYRIDKSRFYSRMSDGSTKMGTRIFGNEKAYSHLQSFNGHIRHYLKWRYNLVSERYENKERHIGIFKFVKITENKRKTIFDFPENVDSEKAWHTTLDSWINPSGMLFHCEVKYVLIKEKHLPYFSQINKTKYIQHCEEYDNNSRLYDYKYNYETDSRLYKGVLRQLVFEKHNYTCQTCGLTIEQAKKKKISLEVDHEVAWVDGGKTTYDNGQVLCSDCNKAKHHIKKIKGSKK